MDNPRVITSPEATSITMPPVALFVRQPTGSSVSPSAVDVARAAALPCPGRSNGSGRWARVMRRTAVATAV